MHVAARGRAGGFSDAVFINCPFDADYWSILEAIVFTVIAAGFRPRCALEELDSGTVRLQKIRSILGACRYGVHDLSRIELTFTTNLPRFNMPFELGLDVGARAFGNGRMKRKRFLILDSRPFRYQVFISDISGQDIQHHNDSPSRVIEVVRNWLRATSGRKTVPGPFRIEQLFAAFTGSLPRVCDQNGLNRDDLLFVDYVELAQHWIRAGSA